MYARQQNSRHPLTHTKFGAYSEEVRTLVLNRFNNEQPALQGPMSLRGHILTELLSHTVELDPTTEAIAASDNFGDYVSTAYGLKIETSVSAGKMDQMYEEIVDNGTSKIYEKAS